jgi:hypothetical protein
MHVKKTIWHCNEIASRNRQKALIPFNDRINVGALTVAVRRKYGVS